ncbi:major facilitator superfamily multidrug-resistance, DHA1 sub-family [Mycena haematopus]|nr:major facilitator superfamily multidrug-resistance, DHA1 sub-family [Mycena haematopus]
MSDDEPHSEETPPQTQETPSTRTPLPKFQLFILLLIQFAEPMTGLVIYPFVVQFVRDTGITGGDETKTGFYAGMLVGALLPRQALTVYQFGRLSDIYGRRPVLLLAPLGLGLAMLGFGLSSSFWTLLGFRFIHGGFNGNLGVAKTVMNEISDPSNVADAFSFLPLMWSVGSTTSPFIGGVLANPAAKWPDTLGKIALLRVHPYFLPCSVASAVAFASFVFAFLGLRETLPSAVERAKNKRNNQHPAETDPLLSEEDAAVAPPEPVPPLRELLTRDVRIALLNHSLLCFSDMAFGALIPLMYSTPIALGGLGLKPYNIGLIMGLCGISNAVTQVVLGGRVIRYFGARRVFSAGFCALMFAFCAFPVLSAFARRAGRVDKAVVVMLVCQLSSVFVLYFSFAATMLFIMDSAPSRASVGSVTGLSQMVGTISRGLAPSIASSLFALYMKHSSSGGYLGYMVLVGIACAALRCSFMLPYCLRSDGRK